MKADIRGYSLLLFTAHTYLAQQEGKCACAHGVLVVRAFRVFSDIVLPHGSEIDSINF